MDHSIMDTGTIGEQEMTALGNGFEEFVSKLRQQVQEGVDGITALAQKAPK
jgi:hypothetical protein